MTTSSDKPQKKMSALKKVGLYVLAWIVLCALFVGYVSIAPNNGGFTQDGVNRVGRLFGAGFIVGLLIVLGFSFKSHFFAPSQKPKDLLNEDWKKKSR